MILNGLHRYNRNLILIGDLNARRPNWHDASSNSSGHRLAEWIDAKQNLKIFNSAKPTSTRSWAVIDLIIASSHVLSELAEIDQKMRVTDHYPVHWRLSSSTSHSSIEYEVKGIDSVMLNCILNLKQNFFFTLSEQMRHQSIEFILIYEAFLVALQERCTTYHKTKSYRSTRSEEHRNSLFSLNKYIHHELRAVKRAQCQEFYLRARAEEYATLLELREKAFQGDSNSNSRVPGWAKPSSDNQYRCHDWTCSTILLGGLQRKGDLLSESRSGRIQAASSWRETSRTSIETVCVRHQRSASVSFAD